MSFEIKPITDFISTNVGKGVQGVKSFTLWLGHSVKSGYSNHIVPAAIRAWNFTLPLIRASVNFFKTGNGLAAVGLVSAVGLYAYGNKLVSPNARFALHVLAGVALVASGVLFGAYGVSPIPGL